MNLLKLLQQVAPTRNTNNQPIKNLAPHVVSEPRSEHGMEVDGPRENITAGDPNQKFQCEQSANQQNCRHASSPNLSLNTV